MEHGKSAVNCATTFLSSPCPGAHRTADSFESAIEAAASGGL